MNNETIIRIILCFPILLSLIGFVLAGIAIYRLEVPFEVRQQRKYDKCKKEWDEYLRKVGLEDWIVTKVPEEEGNNGGK